MSNVVELLNQAYTMEKKAYTDYVTNMTTSGIVNLVQAGVEFNKASQLIKEACEQHPTVNQFLLTQAVFEKAASYIAELEDKLSQVEVEVKAEPLEKLAQKGFSEEELEQMSNLSGNLIEKIASSSTGEPAWGMGQGVGVGIQVDKMDPITAFAMS